MLRNSIKISLRHLQKNPGVSFINIIGLALGLATCLVAALYIKHELSADKFHEDLSLIHRVTVKMKEYSMNGTPYLFGETAQKEIPQVQSFVKTSDQKTSIRIQDDTFKNEVLFADPNFLTFFTFPLEAGNRAKALSGLRNVVISEMIKQKYYKNENALGQTIQIELDNKFEDFEIAGVASPTPTYSSIQFDFLIPLENKFSNDPARRDNWGNFFYTTFLKINPSDIPAVESAMPGFLLRHLPNDVTPEGKPRMAFVMHPLKDHHLSEGFEGGGLRGGKSAKSLLVFGGIAIIILMLACFNFMNITNAQSSRRAIEVGIKKVVGAMRFQLVRQFLSETVILSFLAAALGLVIAELALFVFRDLLQVTVSLFDIQHLDVYAGLVVITVLTGVLAGFYPAIVLASVKTVGILKKQYKVGGTNLLTRSILAMQFMLSIILIVCAIVMWQQQKYIGEKDLGYNEDQVLLVEVPVRDTASMEYLKTEIKKLAEVVNVSKTSSALTLGSDATLHTTQDKRTVFLSLISIDEDYLSTLEMKLTRGENFKDGATRKNSIIVNEKLLRELNLEDSVGIPLGADISYLSRPTIIGVVKDFHHSAMKYEISPLIFLHNESFNHFYLMVRLAPGQTMAGLSKIRSLWERKIPDSTFEFSFLDDNVNKQYEAEQRWSKIITLATGMAILLSILGLVGLATFTAEQRKKEIGIRKVLGASVQEIITLLMHNYLWLIAIAFIAAIPVSYYIMNQYWLNQFAYKIEVGAVVYLVALILVAGIASVAIGSQTFRAAARNPMDVLKEE
jgi:putative ABC transport system permease protein